MERRGIGYPVAQLAHVEIYTPKPEETLWFFTELLGMETTEVRGQSAYLRGYEDFYHHSLVVTEHKEAGLGHVCWRVASEDALREVAEKFKGHELEIGWVEDNVGHGASYRVRTPAGHTWELVWDVEYYQAPPEKRTLLRNRPSRRPLRGVPVRRIDHVNLMCADVVPNKEFAMEHFGFLLRESKIGQGGIEVGAWLSVSPLVHELAFMRDATGTPHRLHHVAFWYGYPQNLMDVADVFSDYGITIEAGPGKHGTTQAYFMYVFEPGGNRIELFGDTGYLIFDPDWKTVVWDVANENDLVKSSIWFGGGLPESFYKYGTPDVSKK